MPEWLNLQDPLAQRIVLGAAGLVLLLLVARVWQRRRQARAAAQRRAALRATYEQLQSEQQEVHRLAGQIVATGSTGTIAGFVIVRQIEAVFAEAQRSPTEAVERLKALAARKGANALINVTSQRLPAGSSVASGDAVIVRPTDTTPAPDTASGPARPGS